MMQQLRFRGFPVILIAILLAITAIAPRAWAQCCVAPDNGSGTATLPPPVGAGGCLYFGTSEVVDGLPVGSTIQINASIGFFTNVTETPGGALLGTTSLWEGILSMSMTGTGGLLGFNRNIQIPLTSGERIYWGPRTPFAPVQPALADLDALQGQILGDPDFDLLRVTGGTAFGMPSPGQVQLTTSAGNWAVSSYFDVYHRVDFIGKNTSPWLAGRSGSTTRQRRFTLCPENAVPVQPSTWSGIKRLLGS